MLVSGNPFLDYPCVLLTSHFLRESSENHLVSPPWKNFESSPHTPSIFIKEGEYSLVHSLTCTGQQIKTYATFRVVR